MENDKEYSKGKQRSSEEEQEGTKAREHNETLENGEDIREKSTKEKAHMGPCKPKAAVIPRIILNDPALQAHRDHMQTYAIICKFMGLWPTEKALQMWIKYHWKPKGNIDLHLGSKGFFTVVFANIEDKDRVFKGGPYFFATAGLYMMLWIMNFVPKCETFTSVPIWVRLYSLPLDYWQTESLSAIGNKLGHFVKAFEATRKGKYTSFARICLEMDLSRAFPDEVILEVIDEEWTQTIDYEHIPFICRKCHKHGCLVRDCPLNKVEDKSKDNVMKDLDSFFKVVHKGKGSKKGLRTSKSKEQHVNQMLCSTTTPHFISILISKL